MSLGSCSVARAPSQIRVRQPPSPGCPWCGSPRSDWPLLSGRGRVFSYTIVHHPATPDLARSVPYNVVVVEPDDAPAVRLISNLLDAAPEEVRELARSGDPAAVRDLSAILASDDDPAIRLVGNLVVSADAPLDSIDPSTVEIGTAVRVVFAEVSDGMHLPRWVRA